MTRANAADGPAGPLVSVILPCLGREAELARAVASLQAQTEPRWELLVVDDASARPLAPLLASVGDPRIRPLRLERNLGPAGARAAAMTLARAPWCAFIDSDDAWVPHALARQIARMAEGPPRVLVAGAEGPPPRGRRPRRPSRPGERIGDYLYVANGYAQVSGVLMPTHLARRAGFGGLRQYEDHYLLLRAEALGAKVEVHGEPLVLRGGGGGLGARDDPDRAAAFLRRAGSLMSATARDGFLLRCLGPVAEGAGRTEALRLARRRLLAPGPLRGAAAKLLLRRALGDRAWRTLRRATGRAAPLAGAPA